jgi:hypothetical protein
VPERGSFVAWKAVLTADGGKAVIRVRIPKDAKRTSTLVGRKCRASHVKVLSGHGFSPTSGHLEYRKGHIVHADKFDDDIRVECTHGIHFFLTRKEAEEY